MLTHPYNRRPLGFALVWSRIIPFIDGNKRIGAHAMLVFLAVNGVELTYTQTQLSDIILQVAADEKDYPDLLDWLLCHQN